MSRIGTATINAPVMPPAISGLKLARRRTRTPVAVKPVPCDESRQHIHLEQRDLIAPEHDQRAGDAGEHTIARG